jgi:hypothetical protein
MLTLRVVVVLARQLRISLGMFGVLVLFRMKRTKSVMAPRLLAEALVVAAVVALVAVAELLLLGLAATAIEIATATGTATVTARHTTRLPRHSRLPASYAKRQLALPRLAS